MKTKEFYDYDQQIAKLKDKNLIINDEEDAIKCLTSEGYYNFINGYSIIFRNQDTKEFYNGITFDNIKSLYNFDKSLRAIIYKNMMTVETNIKSLVAHEFSRHYGVCHNDYLSQKCFSNDIKNLENVDKLINYCKKTINRANNEESNSFKNYIANSLSKHNQVPMWVLVRALTFGTVSKFLSLMKETDKQPIADYYNVTTSQLDNLVSVLVLFRNVVAHGERTFDYKLNKCRLSTSLSVMPKLNIAQNEKGEYKFGRRDFLAAIIAFKYLLNKNDFLSMTNEIIELINYEKTRQNPIIMDKIIIQMGLKKVNWRALPKMNF